MTGPEHCTCLSRREWEVWLQGHEKVHLQTRTDLERAERLMDKRLETMDEFRGQLRDQAATFITRDVAEVRHGAFDARLDRLTDRLDKQERWQSGIEGRTIGAAAAVSLVVTILGIAIAIGLTGIG